MARSTGGGQRRHRRNGGRRGQTSTVATGLYLMVRNRPTPALQGFSTPAWFGRTTARPGISARCEGLRQHLRTVSEYFRHQVNLLRWEHHGWFLVSGFWFLVPERVDLMRNTPALGLMAAPMIAQSGCAGGRTADPTTAAASTGASATETAAAKVYSEDELRNLISGSTDTDGNELKTPAT